MKTNKTQRQSQIKIIPQKSVPILEKKGHRAPILPAKKPPKSKG